MEVKMQTNRLELEKKQWQVSPVDEKLRRDLRVYCIQTGKENTAKAVEEMVRRFVAEPNKYKGIEGLAKKHGYTNRDSKMNLGKMTVRWRDKFIYIARNQWNRHVFELFADLITYHIKGYDK